MVETADTIYMVEIKAYNRTDESEVKLKAKAARAYCKNVNAIYAGTGKNPWKYLLITDSEVTRSTTLAHLVQGLAVFDYAAWDEQELVDRG